MFKRLLVIVAATTLAVSALAGPVVAGKGGGPSAKAQCVAVLNQEAKAYAYEALSLANWPGTKEMAALFYEYRDYLDDIAGADVPEEMLDGSVKSYKGLLRWACANDLGPTKGHACVRALNKEAKAFAYEAVPLLKWPSTKKMARMAYQYRDDLDAVIGVDVPDELLTGSVRSYKKLLWWGCVNEVGLPS